MSAREQDQGDLRHAGRLGRLVLSADSCSELLRAVAPTPARALTERRRGELIRMVERRWQEQAACASSDPVAWYPENRAVPPGQVFRICAACPVARSCLAVALLWDEDGIWAGTTPSQRDESYGLLRVGVSVQAVVHLLLTQQAPTAPQATSHPVGGPVPMRQRPEAA